MEKYIIKSEINNLINNVKYEPMSFEEIKKELDLENDEDLNDVLNELISEYKLFKSKNGKYLNDRKANKYLGKMYIRNNDYGFVSNPYYDDLYVDSAYFKDAMDKDEVLYAIDETSFKNSKKSLEAKVLKVVKRYFEYLVGEIVYENGRTVLETYEKNFHKKCVVTKLLQAKVGDIVRAKIVDYGYFLKAEVCDVLGNKKSLGIDITSVVVKNNIPYIFPNQVIEDANNLENDAKDKKYEHFNNLIFTIDGDDAKDLDDAISITKTPFDTYKVGIYIADVSHYVQENSSIDIEALNRGTSIYLVDRVIPMLPERLSNDLCSLNPNEEKLVMALFMEVDKKGCVLDKEVKEGVIKTSKRLSYEKCNDVLENGLINYPDYEIALEPLKIMKELSEILTDKRNKRGAINFDVDEPKIICDEKGKAIDIQIRKRGVSERIIEEFMILANETVSELVYQFDLPFVYRVHEEPDIVKFHILKEMVSKLGYSIRSMHPMEFQKLLNDIDEENSYLKTSVLRLMNKAVYSEENIGHFGLASRCYTHFTSPIRRYPDLIVHRLLRKYIIDHDNVLNNNEYNVLTQKIHVLAGMCSEKEKRAVDCEFKVLDMKKAEYMEKYLGYTFTGIVTSIHKFGVFVTLENTVDGLIKTQNLFDNDFVYDSQKNIFVNKQNNKKIILGETLKVKLMSINKKIGEIDFEMVYNKGKKKKSHKRRY